VLFFGYTSCPDFCPATMSKIGAALGRLGEARDQVLPVFVSVDPERDTPAALDAYTSNFRVGAVGLTGSAEALQQVVDKYAAFSEKAPSSSAMGYLVSHTTYLYVIDRQGRVRKLVRHDDGVEVLAEALRRVLS
jgi:protein SCO1